jgi:hypothetical protein
MSIRGSLFRYQGKGHIHRGNDFYKVFIDGGWKWKGQQRYAGVHVDKHTASPGEPPKEYKINVGHYFARGQQGARAEMLHYTTNKEELAAKYSLLEVEADLDNVLDLTDLEVIRAVADATYISGNIWDILKDLIGEETGGGAVPTTFGYYASRRAHSAILTFSARALHPEHAAQLRSEFWDEVAEDIVKGAVIEKMRDHTNRQCVVVLSGSLLTRLVKRYRYDEAAWEDNPLFGKSAKEIDALWGEFGPDFQASQGRVSYVKKRERFEEGESAS